MIANYHLLSIQCIIPDASYHNSQHHQMLPFEDPIITIHNSLKSFYVHIFYLKYCYY